MVSRKKFLKNALTEEARAYGFTIAFWGSGALLVNYSGLPNVTQALFYGLGALTGFALLNLYVYRGAFQKPKVEDEEKLLVLSMIHYFGALLPIAAAHYLARLEEPSNFFFTGLSVSVLYNLGMVVEEILSEKGRELEERLYRYI